MLFSQQTYIQRRETLRKDVGTGVIILLGNNDSAMNYPANAYKFRQDSSFLYFWGIDEPLYAATLDLESGAETVYGDDYGIDDIIWMGPQESVASKAASVGVAATAPYAAFLETIAKARAAGRQVHFLPVSRYYNAIKLSAALGLSPDEVTISGKKGCAKASLPLVESAVSMRLVKSPEEIAELDKVGDIGCRMHDEARNNIRLGLKEQIVVGKMEAVAATEGWGCSFPTILTQHGEIFHCHSHECAIEEGRLLVVDAGVESVTHYASDHTRTYPTGGRFTQKQRDIYQIVCDCNNLAFSLTGPGTTYLSVHLAVAREMLDRLASLGLVHGNVDDMVAEGIAGLFMPHGLGHNMGIDVHDMEDYGEDLVGYDHDQKRSSQLGLGSLRMARRLVPGNVVTDEPGIYFIPDLIELWKKEGTDKGFVNYDKLREYYGFGGIRLEDDVLVTEDGARRLGSGRLPIEPDDVEEAMNKD